MSIVRFATTCDIRDCGTRSEEYQMWPVCRECQQDVCPTHMAPDSFHDGDGETRSSVVCVECAGPLAIVIEPLAVAALIDAEIARRVYAAVFAPPPTDLDVCDTLAAYDREQAK